MRATGEGNSLPKNKINAMCNLAALYGQRVDDEESTRKSFQLSQDAIAVKSTAVR